LYKCMIAVSRQIAMVLCNISDSKKQVMFLNSYNVHDKTCFDRM